MGKEALRLQVIRYLLVIGEFLAVLVRQSVDVISM